MLILILTRRISIQIERVFLLKYLSGGIDDAFPIGNCTLDV